MKYQVKLTGSREIEVDAQVVYTKDDFVVFTDLSGHGERVLAMYPSAQVSSIETDQVTETKRPRSSMTSG